MRYGIYDFHGNPADYFIPSDPLTWTQFLRDLSKPILKPIIENAASVGIDLIICPPPCGEILASAAMLDSVNSAITFDTHPYKELVICPPIN